MQHGVLSLQQETHLNSNPCSALTSWVTLEVTYYLSVLISTVGMKPLDPSVVEKTKEIILIKMHLA